MYYEPHKPKRHDSQHTDTGTQRVMRQRSKQIEHKDRLLRATLSHKKAHDKMKMNEQEHWRCITVRARPRSSLTWSGVYRFTCRNSSRFFVSLFLFPSHWLVNARKVERKKQTVKRNMNTCIFCLICLVFLVFRTADHRNSNQSHMK